MVKVEFLGPIEKAPMFVKATTLSDIADILNEDKEIASWLDKSAVAINDNIVSSLKITLKDGDRVSILPPVCGG